MKIKECKNIYIYKEYMEMEPTKIDDVLYETIYHLADIHIKPIERHEEYREIFDKVYKILKGDKRKKMIVIAGDILDEKDKLKPENIIVARDFFINLCKYGTLVIIDGNHDIIQGNTTRTTNLTALCDGLDVKYLQKSGVYIFGKLNIIVLSIVDQKEVEPIQNGNKNIALYHGTLDGAKLYNGQEAKEKNKKVSDFAKFDLTLLGDIHKFQYLKNNIAYSGSLIQQNFGESIDYHGFIRWDVSNLSPEYIEIPNLYGFVTIDIDKDNYTLPKLPQYPYIRIRTKNTKNTTIDKLKEELTKTYKIQTIKVEPHTDREVITNIAYQHHQDDIEMINQECQLKKLPQFKTEKILELHKKFRTHLYSLP